MQMADTDDILGKIEKGIYKLVGRRGKSAAWDCFAQIEREDGSILKPYVICRTCSRFFRFNGKQTTNLLRHKCPFIIGPNSSQSKGVTAGDKIYAIKALSEWIIEDCRSLTAINAAGFEKLALFLVQMGSKKGLISPDNVFPNASTVEARINESATEQKTEVTNNLEKQVREGNAAASVDIWTDNYLKINFLSATLHFFDGGNLKHAVLGVESVYLGKSSEINIQNKLRSIFSNYDIHNTESMVFVTDGESSNVQTALQNNTTINCSHRIFTNMINSALQNTKALKPLIAACKTLIKYFKNPILGRGLQLTLTSDCSSRWNSYLQMFQFIEENWAPINAILEERGEQDRLRDIDINILNSLIELHQYFDIVSRKIQDYRCASICYVLVSIIRLQEKCAPYHADAPALVSFKYNITSYIEHTWLPNLSIYHKVALFLHPLAKNMITSDFDAVAQCCIQHIAAIKEEMSQYAAELPQTSSRTTSWTTNLPDNTISDLEFFFPTIPKANISGSVAAEIEKYRMESIQVGNDFNEIDWWHKNSTLFPRLSKFAVKIFTIPASSVASERAAFAAANLIIGKSSELTLETVDNVLFLNTTLYNN